MNNSTESIERLLHVAAGFEPEQPCPNNLVETALQRAHRGHRSTAAWALAFGVCALAWVALSQLRKPAIPTEPAQPRETQRQVIALNDDSDQGSIGVAPPKKIREKSLHSQIKERAAHPTARRKPKNVVRLKHPDFERHRSAVRQRPMVAALPRAIWRDEEVHSYRTGVMAAALVVSADDDNHIHLQPGVIQVPLAEGRLVAGFGAESMKENQQ